ncbi:MAG: ribose-phosphate diphosphokinase [Planctomycetota bacterium]|nr:ribose-phosphate diphosphokinase [Planctomycetota bacterium]
MPGPRSERPAVLFAFDEQADLGRRIARRLGWSFRGIDVHYFPDGESLVRLKGSPGRRPAAVLRSLDHPNQKLLEVIMALETVRREGATRRILVAPYVGYMRQDAIFRPGEALSQAVIGKLLGRCSERIVTVDAHLHRVSNLWAIFRRPGSNLHAAPLFAPRLRSLQDPLLIGPDEESAPWIAALASASRVKGVTARKKRQDDEHVAVKVPDGVRIKGRDLVFFDDVVSTGNTAIALAKVVRRKKPRSMRLFATHAVFAGDAEERIRAAGIEEIVSSNSISHPTNGVDLAGPLAEALGRPRVQSG